MDYDVAHAWLAKAVARDDNQAKTRLGLLYLEHPREAGDAARGEALLLDAAKRGSVAAAAQLGQLYAGAYKTRPRPDEALRWRRAAAEGGHLGALFALTAALLESGDPAQEQEAAQWLERAAAQGHAASQFELAVLYCTGKGVEKNLSEAVGWYEKAAQEGHVMAKHNLGVMLIKGMGVEPDPERGARLVQEAGVVREGQAG